MAKRPIDRTVVVTDLAKLERLDLPALRGYWQQAFGKAPPAHLREGVMRLALSYRIQERALGGLNPRVRRMLDRVASDLAAGLPVLPTNYFKPGTRLLREWHGVTHQVELLEDGVLFQGERYRSLSQIARLITGARWSGPLFFGLKARRL